MHGDYADDGGGGPRRSYPRCRTRQCGSRVKPIEAVYYGMSPEAP